MLKHFQRFFFFTHFLFLLAFRTSAQDITISAVEFQNLRHLRSLTNNDALKQGKIEYTTKGKQQTEFSLYFDSAICVQTVDCGKEYRRMPIISQNFLVSPFQAYMLDGKDTLELIIAESEETLSQFVLIRVLQTEYCEVMYFPYPIVDFVFFKKIKSRLRLMSEPIHGFELEF